MSNRVSNFKRETATDTKQDGEISTLTTTLNNLVIPDQSIISPNVINLGGTGGVRLVPEDTQMTVYGSAYYTKEITSNESISAPIVYTNLALLGTNNNYITSTLAIDGAQNVIRSERNASITGINEITCNKLNLGGVGGMVIRAEGTQFTALGSGYFSNALISGEEISAPLVSAGVLSYTTLDPPIANNSLLTYHVDGSCGSDSYDGSILHPFKTIQKAVTICESVYDGTAREIKVAFGSYVENLTITKARIKLSGSHESRFANVACGINGNINVQVAGSVDLFNSQVMITGFQIVGQILDTSSSVHTLNIKDCFIYGVPKLITQSSTVDSRTYLENLTIQASVSTGLNPLVEMNSGGIYMTMCSLTHIGAGYCLNVQGTSSIYSMSLNTFTNDNAGSLIRGLVNIYTSSTSPQTIANCGFVYSSSTPKSTSANSNISLKCGMSPLMLINNTFILTGCTNIDNAVVASGMVLYSGNCATTAYIISASSKYPLTTMS